MANKAHTPFKRAFFFEGPLGVDHRQHPAQSVPGPVSTNYPATRAEWALLQAGHSLPLAASGETRCCPA